MAGMKQGIATIARLVLNQVLGKGDSYPQASRTRQDIYFTNNFQTKAKDWGLSEADARDVYRHGEEVKPQMLVRKYNGYEIGIYYFTDTKTGKPIISSIWKRNRR